VSPLTNPSVSAEFLPAIYENTLFWSAAFTISFVKSLLCVVKPKKSGSVASLRNEPTKLFVIRAGVGTKSVHELCTLRVHFNPVFHAPRTLR
jgi:hypothetical protein